MSVLRWAGLALFVMAATIAQVVLFRYVSIDGVVPNLTLLLVVVAAFARGPRFGAGLGFAAGLFLDLTPPADHVAGRWALALVIVGYLAGRVRNDARSSMLTTVLVVGACSFVGTSVYALTGVVLHDGTPATGSIVQVIGLSVLWDMVLSPLLVPAFGWLLERLRPPRYA